MANGLNPAEQFVAAHCDQTFLSLWGMANPFGDDPGKELCDYIVVCDPHAIVFSVKEIGLAPEPEPLAVERWLRKAVEGSAKQIYGAERALARLHQVRDSRGRVIRLPPLEQRQLHRVAVAFGSKGQVPLGMGDFGRGFVHVMEEVSFPTLLRELDTIGDFTTYLARKAEHLEAGRRIVSCGEENLLALYLRGNRTFPAEHDLIVIDDNCWKALIDTDEYKARQQAGRASYAWDKVIEYVTRDLLKDALLYADPPTEAERVLRVMAQEDRFCRRFLAESLNEVVFGGKVRSRALQSYSGVAYVFLALDRGEDREYRIAELGLRCKVARGQFRDATTVVAIATERADGKPGLSFDLLLLEQANWTEADEEEVVRIKKELGFFKAPEVTSKRVDEYPKS